MGKRLGRVAVFLMAAVAALTVFGACAGPAEEKTPAEITDQLGRTVQLEGVPQRIISLAPSNTEILFALGLGDRVVAVTDYCDCPEEAKDKPSIGGFSTPNIEQIVSYNPDMVVAVLRHEDEIIPQLESRGITVLGLNPTTIEEVMEALELVGQVTGTTDKAEEVISDMKARIKAVDDKISTLSESEKPRVFYAVWNDPLMLAGSNTMQSELIVRAGGINIAGDMTDYPSVSLEDVLVDNPEVMIASYGTGMGEDQIFNYIKEEPRLAETDAGKSGRIYAIDGDLVSRAGPRIVDGLEEYARLLHPDLFGEQ